LGLLTWLVAGLLSGPLFAQRAPLRLTEPKLTEKVFIAADQVDYDQARQMLHLTGHVEIRQEPYRLLANDVEINMATRQAFASGQVRITTLEGGEGKTNRTVLSADQAQVDLSGTPLERGWMMQARLSVPWQEGEFNFQGRRMKRVNENTYEIEQGSMTPCQCPPNQTPDWEVQARRLTAETQQQASLSSARIKIRGRTVFYLPFLAYPIGTERRPGFLLPVLDYSNRNGFEATLPFFWPFVPSADLTLLPHYLERRGFEAGAEARYNLGPAAEGIAHGYYIWDQQEQVERWSAQLQHTSNWGQAYSVKTDLNLISDNEYLTDFNHDVGHRYDRFLESRMIAERAGHDTHAYAEFSWFDDLQGGDLRPSPAGPDRDALMVQRLPEVRFQLLTRQLLGPLYTDVALRADDYWREDLSLGRGQMLDLFPRLVLPARLGPALHFFAAAGFHGLLYYPDPAFNPDASAFGQAEAAAEISSEFFRVYPGRPDGNRYRHTLEPKLLVFYQSEPNQPPDSFFPAADPRPELGFFGLNLESRLFSNSNAPAPASPTREMSRVELTQYYDWVHGDFPDLRLEGRSALGHGFRLEMESFFGWDDHSLNRVESRLSYHDPRQNEFMFGYRWDTGQVNTPFYQFQTRRGNDLLAGTELDLGSRLRLRYRAHYSLEYDRFVAQLLGFNYQGKQKCWGLGLALADRLRPDQPNGPHDYSGQVTFQLEK
jgi:LPS-assembly protein